LKCRYQVIAALPSNYYSPTMILFNTFIEQDKRRQARARLPNTYSRSLGRSRRLLAAPLQSRPRACSSTSIRRRPYLFATIPHCCRRSFHENGSQRTSLAGLIYQPDLAHPLGHGYFTRAGLSFSSCSPFRRPAGLELLRPSEITLQMKGLISFWGE
jgi:hypothetical protein